MTRARAALLLAALLPGCGGSPSSPPSGTPATFRIEAVVDGDTVRIQPALMGTTSVRLVNIDAPELDGQQPWAGESRESLLRLVPPGTAVTVATDRQPRDTFGRVLGRVSRAADGVDANREQVRAGQAVTYVIWPNVASYEADRAAQIQAQDAGRGVWDPARPLPELPFVFRLAGRTPDRPTGDVFTRYFVDGASFALVHVNNRVFFGSEGDAQGAAGYRPCPRDAAGAYAAECFAPGR